jgi:hypothetical protein
MLKRLTPGAIALLLLVGCSASLPEQPTPSLAPTPKPETATGPTIEAGSAALEPVRQPVPPVRVQVADGVVDVEVVPVGVLADGQMELPEDPAVAGWYRFGPDPAGVAGTTVIAAHVDSYRYGLGPFAQLRDLPPGTAVTIVTADGTAHHYAIDSVQRVPRSQLPLDQVFDRTGSPRVVLITCGGAFDGREYADNVVVVAVPVPS